MSSSYDAMWEKLNLDLDAHAGLLEVLGKFYGDIYMSQQGRLKGMEYLDFVLSEVHGLRIKELQDAKALGKKIVGTFCVFVPEEIVLAAGGIQVGLCAGAEIGSAEAEKVLPRNTCALIKSFVGFKLSRLCPYIESCDLIVGETTCDGKKKAYEIFSDYSPVYVMEIPQMKNAADLQLWKSEVQRFKSQVEETTGNKITADSLKEAIHLLNNRRRVLQRLSRLRAAAPAPISGRDALLINQISFYDDPVRFTAKIGELCDELDERVKSGIGVAPEGTTRLMLSGCPMAVPNWKLPYVIESSGAIVVGEESCIGTRNTRDLVNEGGLTVEQHAGRHCGQVYANRLRLLYTKHGAVGQYRKDGSGIECKGCDPLRTVVLPALCHGSFQSRKGAHQGRHPDACHRNRLQYGGCGAAKDPRRSFR